MKYQGWTNIETWLTALWIQNDEKSYFRARGIKSSMELARWWKAVIQMVCLYNKESAMSDDFENLDFTKVDWKEIFYHIKN